MTDAEFWAATPRKIMALKKVHDQLNGGGSQAEAEEKIHFADELPFLL